MGEHTDVSDGYHTFGELYRHRHALFLTLLRLNWTAESMYEAWWTKEHHPDNDPMFDDMILVGLELPGLGSVQYHLPTDYISAVDKWAQELAHGPYYDGTASPDAVVRWLEEFGGYEATKWQ
jgi:hypothetical protein